MSNGTRQPISLAVLGERTGAIGRHLSAMGILMQDALRGETGTHLEQAYCALGEVIHNLGKELQEFEEIPLVDHAGKPVK